MGRNTYRTKGRRGLLQWLSDHPGATFDEMVEAKVITGTNRGPDSMHRRASDAGLISRDKAPMDAGGYRWRYYLTPKGLAFLVDGAAGSAGTSTSGTTSEDASTARGVEP